MARGSVLDSIDKLLIGKLFYHSRSHFTFLVKDIVYCDSRYPIKALNLTSDINKGFSFLDMDSSFYVDSQDLTEDEAQNLAYWEIERQKESPLAQTAQTPKKPKMTPQVVGEKREHP